jgi:hypothetical protein
MSVCIYIHYVSIVTLFDQYVCWIIEGLVKDVCGYNYYYPFLSPPISVKNGKILPEISMSYRGQKWPVVIRVLLFK